MAQAEQHTPGPWRLDEPRYAHVLDERKYHIIDAGLGCFPRGFHLAAFMSGADARLIAAAPALYAALINMLDDGDKTDRQAAIDALVLAGFPTDRVTGDVSAPVQESV